MLAVIVCLLVTPFSKKLAVKFGAVDDPTRDERRVHTQILPRWGGIAIFAGVFVSVLVAFPLRKLGFPNYMLGILATTLVLVIFGALDDIKQFSAKLQLVVLLGAGVLVQFFGGKGEPQVAIKSLGFFGHIVNLGWAAIPFTAIYIFVITKTMDTIDGVDGLASGIAVICSITFTFLAWLAKAPSVAIISASIGGAALGFLWQNYNPAKVIMGTGGAYTLGFMLACVSILGGFKSAVAVSVLIPVLAFGIPIFDAFFVIIRRLLSGQPITQPDKRHLHHTLLAKGLSQRQTVWVLFTVAIALSLILVAVVVRYGHA